MLTDVNTPDTTPEASPRQKPSAAVKLIQAAALAATLVPLGSVAIEAETISCGFASGSFFGIGSGGGCTSDDSGRAVFDFGSYFLDLRFNDMVGEFDVSVTDAIVTETDFESRSDGLAGDYECIEMTSGGPCVEFIVEAPSVPQWSSYEIGIFWFYDTNAIYPNNDPDGTGPLPGQVRILHNPGGDGSNAFRFDMCTAGETGTSSYLDCEYFPKPNPDDPGIRSGDTFFSSYIAAWTPTPVPEPGSLSLLALGAGGILLRRRKEQKA